MSARRSSRRSIACRTTMRSSRAAAASKPAAGAAGRPKETAAERSSARDRQREILEKELATEQAALAKAQQDLAAQESVRSGGERNYARVEERLQPFKDSVETHQ